MSAADIAANNRAFEKAVETGNVEAIAALLAPDVISLPPDGPIVAGREAVKQLWASAIRAHGMTKFQDQHRQTRCRRRRGKRSWPCDDDYGAAGRQERDGKDQISGCVEAAQRHVASASRHL